MDRIKHNPVKSCQILFILYHPQVTTIGSSTQSRTSNRFPVSPSFPSHLHTAEDYDPIGMLPPPQPPHAGGRGRCVWDGECTFRCAFYKIPRAASSPPRVGGLGGAPKRRLRYRFHSTNLQSLSRVAIISKPSPYGRGLRPNRDVGPPPSPPLWGGWGGHPSGF